MGGGRDRSLGGWYERRGVAPVRVYQLQFRFFATTLTLLFTVYVVVLLVTVVFLGSASDYLGRRPVMLAALALGAVASGLVLLAHGVGLLFTGRAAALGGNAHAGKADAACRCGCGALPRAPVRYHGRGFESRDRRALMTCGCVGVASAT